MSSVIPVPASEGFEAHQTVEPHQPLNARRPSVDGRRAFDGFTENRSLARMLAGIIGLRLREIARGVLHELGLGVLAAEAIGLASNLPIDGAVGFYVFAECEPHCAHVAVLAGHGQSRRGQAKQ